MKTYADGSAKIGNWDTGSFQITDSVPDHERKNNSEAAKPIDENKFGKMNTKKAGEEFKSME